MTHHLIYLEVYESLHAASPSGVPEYTRFPPASPASGPRSITQSADLITSGLCSTTTIVCPLARRPLGKLPDGGHIRPGKIAVENIAYGLLPALDQTGISGVYELRVKAHLVKIADGVLHTQPGDIELRMRRRWAWSGTWSGTWTGAWTGLGAHRGQSGFRRGRRLFSAAAEDHRKTEQQKQIFCYLEKGELFHGLFILTAYWYLYFIRKRPMAQYAFIWKGSLMAAYYPGEIICPCIVPGSLVK